MGFEPVHQRGRGEVLGYLRRAPSASAHLVVFLPPATGILDPLLAEASTISSRGHHALVLVPPYIRERNLGSPRGLDSPENEKRFWIRNAEEIAAVVNEARQNQQLDGQTVLVGKNLGGSYAAFTASYVECDFLLAYGSIPRLSDFWSHSQHPVATKFRQDREHLLYRFVETMRSQDLLSSLRSSQVPAFLQLGSRDEWIDHKQRKSVEEARIPSLSVRWYDDDHEMESPRTREERLSQVRLWLGESPRDLRVR